MSAWLRKTRHVPGGAPGGYVWNTPEDVVEVLDDVLAAELCEIPDAGFVSVAAPEAVPDPGPEKAPVQESGAAPEPIEPSADAGHAPEAKPAARPHKTAASKAAAAKTTPQQPQD